jgi:hypothetical protein
MGRGLKCFQNHPTPAEPPLRASPVPEIDASRVERPQAFSRSAARPERVHVEAKSLHRVPLAMRIAGEPAPPLHLSPTTIEVPQTAPTRTVSDAAPEFLSHGRNKGFCSDCFARKISPARVAKLANAPDLGLRNHRIQNVAFRFKSKRSYEGKRRFFLKSNTSANDE